MLKAAKLEKNSSDVESGSTRIGASCMQGWRFHMEDAHRVVADLDGKGMAFAGVYDSHVNPKPAFFCAEKMHCRVLENLQKFGDGDLRSVLHRSFLQIDDDFRSTINPSLDSLIRAGGCTATVVLQSENKVVVANVGDTRCIMSRRGGVVEELTRDHKPTLPDERKRIEAGGGKIFLERLGGLNISRGIGDFRLKIPSDSPPELKQLTAVPETKQVEFEGDEVEFVIVASDGVWESKASQQVVEFVREKLNKESKNEGSKEVNDQKANQESIHTECNEPKLSKVCEELMDWCIKKNLSDLSDWGTTDNLTVVILQPSRSNKNK